MALLTVHLRLVSPHGEDDTPLPASGRVEFIPVAHGKYHGSLRAIERVTSQIREGVMTPVELTPAAWSVTIVPTKGNPWPQMFFELVEGMPEPINLADLLPDLIIEGEKYIKGDPGPTIASWEDNEDGTITFIMTDGTRVGPGALPVGPPGRGIESISDPDGNSNVVITYSDGTTETVRAIEGAPSTVPGPANTLSVGTVEGSDEASARITGISPNQVLHLGLPQGEQGPSGNLPVEVSTAPPEDTQVIWVNPEEGTLTIDDVLIGPEGPEGPKGDQGVQGPIGPKGDAGNLGTTIIYGVGRPDDTTTMTTETAASVALASSGAEFVSTDGPQGAWKWQKQGTAWIATIVDTGWRNITADLDESPTSGRVLLRRNGKVVHLHVDGLTYATNASFKSWGPVIPSGFRPPAEIDFAAGRRLASDPGGSIRVNRVTGNGFAYQVVEGLAIRASGSWVTDEAAPTSLPGTAA